MFRCEISPAASTSEVIASMLYYSVKLTAACYLTCVLENKGLFTFGM